MKNSLFKYSCLFITLSIVLVGLGCISAADTGSNSSSDTSGITAGTASQDNEDVISEAAPEDKQANMNNVNTGNKKKNTKNLKNAIPYNSSEYMYSNPSSRHNYEYRYNYPSFDDNFNNYYPDAEFYKEKGDRFFKNVSVNSYDNIKSTIKDTDQYLLIINLKNGTYTSTGNITINNAMHNYIINGNNQTVNGNQSQLLSIGSGSSLVLNNIHIINASITDNSVIYNDGTLIINNSVLTGNNAVNGGIIYNKGTLILNNSVIKNNSAVGRGIIYNKGKILINNSVLSGNNAINSSVVYNDQGTVVVNNSRLSGNYVTCDRIRYSQGTITIYNYTITSNDGIGKGVIYTRGKLIINNSSLSDNTAVNGSVIYNDEGTAVMNNSWLSGNSAGNGGIYNSFNLTVNNSTIDNNRVISGGAVYNDGGNCIINNSFILNNNATENGGAVYHTEEEEFLLIYGVHGNLVIDNSILNNNTAGYGGALYLNGISGGYNSTFSGNVLINNTAIDNNSAVTGGAVYNVMAKTVARYQYDYGVHGNVLISNSKIRSNKAVNASAVYNMKGLTIDIFYSRLARFTITNTTIADNNAAGNATIYNNAGSITVTDSKLANNTVKDNGGAIYNLGGNVLTDNSQLTGNHAARGGAVYNKEYINREDSQTHISSTLTITNTKFISNYDTKHELIYDNYTNTSNTLTIENNTYTGNYLKTSTNTKPVNKKLNNTDYTTTIQIKTLPIYNTTINTGNINIIINNKLYKKVQVKDSKAVITIPVEDFTQRDNNITYKYISNNNSYQSLTLKNTITINKTYIIADDVKGQLGSNIKLNATIKDQNNKIISKGRACIKINNKTYAYTNITEKGEIIYILNLSPEQFGKYNYTVTYVYAGTEKVPSAHKSVTMTVIPYKPVIKLPVTTSCIADTTVLNVQISNGTTYKALSGNVRFKLNNITYKVNGTPLKVQVTNGTAVLKFYTSSKFVGTNNITILYSGNGKFESQKTTFINVYIVKNVKKTIINTPSVTTGRLEENTTLRATFTDQLKKPLKSGTVVIKINGKTLTHTEIKNGQVTYKLYLDPKKYSPKNYTITFKFGGKGIQLPAATNTTLKVEKITPIFAYNKTTAQKGTIAKITLKIQNSNIPATGTAGLKINGKTVKINNKTYITNLINNTATFSIPVTDNMKTSNITFTYSGDKKYDGGRITIKDGLIIINSTRITSLFVQLQSEVTKETVNDWTKAGITDVYVQAKASTNDTKQLDNIINLTRKTNIRVHAWVICFATSNGINISITQQNMIKNFITQIIKTKDINGICLDYVRYDGKNKTETNATVITNFVKSVNNIVKGYNKSLQLSACLFPEKQATPIYYGQDYEALSPYLDVELIMTYKYDYNKNTAWMQDVIEYVVKKAKYSQVVSILQTYDTQYKPVSTNELTNDAKSVIIAGSNGYALFRYGLLSGYPTSANNIIC